ncbi:oligoendopeptidase F family protein [Spiroplasma clarkii]|uniref:oligoendopeptidase F family protein n=1 Tax=Spiroplasma clarkii TaxID=2139 RepID=UPI0011BAD8A2|nr:oligoendopeptidase F family protein [Spiroplasma clarkii]
MRQLDVDQTQITFQKYDAIFRNTVHKVERDLSFLEPEILALDSEQVLEWVKASKQSQYFNNFKILFANKKHYLSADSEKLLSIVAKSRQNSQEIYQTLAYADKTQATFKFQGKNIVVDNTFIKRFVKTLIPTKIKNCEEKFIIYF